MAKTEGEMTWKDVEIGAISTEPGSACAYKTGAWRSQRPTYEFKKCIKCGMCALFCPEACISQQQDGYFLADMFYCKGCGICAHECWTSAINMVEEA